MSSDKTAPQMASNDSTTGKIKVDPAAERKAVSIRNVDVSELQIDETFDADCDPYNSTGEFLADAIKKKYDDQ